MKTIKLISIILFLASVITVYGQTGFNPVPEKPFIEVTGTAEKEVVPDEIYINITIRERHERKAKITIERQEADLKEALEKAGFSLDNLFLSDANANYIRVRWTKKDVITKAEYILKVATALDVAKVFEKLDELKIVDAYVSKVSHSKLTEFKKEVKIMAIKAAKEKADYLMSAIGGQTGKAIKVNEVSPNYLHNNANINMISNSYEEQAQYRITSKAMGSDKGVIQFKKIKLQSSIYVKFEI